jgi:chromosome segregation ATPase
MELEEIRDNQIETQDKIDDRRVDLEDVRNDIEDLTEEDFGNEDEDEVKKILDTLEELRKEESNLEKEIEKLEALFRDYESDAVDIVMNAMPQPGMNYVDYAENIMNVNLNVVDPSELPEPEEPNGREIDEDD